MTLKQIRNKTKNTENVFVAQSQAISNISMHLLTFLINHLKHMLTYCV